MTTRDLEVLTRAGIHARPASMIACLIEHYPVCHIARILLPSNIFANGTIVKGWRVMDNRIQF